MGAKVRNFHILHIVALSISSLSRNSSFHEFHYLKILFPIKVLHLNLSKNISISSKMYLKGMYVTFRKCLSTMTPAAVKLTAVCILLLFKKSFKQNVDSWFFSKVVKKMLIACQPAYRFV